MNNMDDQTTDTNDEKNNVDDESSDVEPSKKILLLVDLKKNQTLNDLNDPQMLRTIIGFFSSFIGDDIEVIPLHELPNFAMTPNKIDDIYLIGHGTYSSLGSGMTVDDCSELFKTALSTSDFMVDHIHLTVCHSAGKSVNEIDRSLLYNVHNKLNFLKEKPVKITGYQNQIHLVRTELLSEGIRLDIDMPYAPIIHRGLQSLISANDSKTLTGYAFKELVDFFNYYRLGVTPDEPGIIFNTLNAFVTFLNNHGQYGSFKNIIELENNLENILNGFDKSLINSNIDNKISIDQYARLSESFRVLNLDQLIDKLDILKANKDTMQSDEINEEFNQIYLALKKYKKEARLEKYESYGVKSNSLSDEINKCIKMQLKVDQPSMEITKIINNKINIFCQLTLDFVEELYFENQPIDWKRKMGIVSSWDLNTIIRDTPPVRN